MKRYFFILSCILSLYCHAGPGDYLVCIHGFFGDEKSMKKIVTHFKELGRDIENWGYPSRDKWIQEHAHDLVVQLNQMHRDHPTKGFDFVAHSLGGLILRCAINHPDFPEIAKHGKAVLLAPPNGGSCWARFLKNIPFSKQIVKKRAGKELLDEEFFDYLGDFPSSLRVLVIAGNGGINPFFMGEHDGVVAVRETYLNTPHDHVVIKAGHHDILSKKRAIRLIDSFLN